MELVAHTNKSPESSSPNATTSVSGPEEDIEEVENKNEVLSSGSLKTYDMVDVPDIEDMPISQCELPENTDGLPLKQDGEIYNVGDDSFIQGSMPAMELNSKEEYSISANAELEMMKEDLEYKMVEQLEKLSRLLNLETAHNGADHSHMKREIGTLVSSLKEEMDGCYDDDDDDEDADCVCTSSDPDEKYEYWQVDYSTGTLMWNPPKGKQDSDASLGVAVSKYMPSESVKDEEDEAEETEDEAEEAEEEGAQVLPAITESPPSTRLFEETETNEPKQSESTAQSGAENVDEFSAKLASDIITDVLAEFPNHTFDSAQSQITGRKGRNSAAVVASGQIFVIKEEEDEEEAEESVQILQAITDSPQVSVVFEDTENGQEEQNECTYAVQSGAATDVDECSTEFASAIIDDVVALVSSHEPKASEKEIDTEKSSKSAASVASELSFRSGSSVTIFEKEQSAILSEQASTASVASELSFTSGSSVTIFEKEQSAILSEQASTAASTSTSPLECVVNSAQKMSSTLSRDDEFDCENTFESESTRILKSVNTPNSSILLATSSASTGCKSILMLPADSNTGDISIILTSPSNDNEEGVASSNSEDRHGIADETEMEINSAPILFSSAASHAPSIEGENVTRPEAIEPDDDDNEIVLISKSGEAVYMSPTTSNAELVQEVKETAANDMDEITERGSQWLKSSCQSVRKTGGMKLSTSLAGFRQSDLEEAADLPDRRSRAKKLGLFTAKSKPDTLPNECRITLRRLSNPDRTRVSFEELLHANVNGEATNLNTQVSVSSSDSEQRIRNDQSVDVKQSSHTSLSDNDKYVAASPSKESKRSSRSSVRSSKSKVVAVNSESVSSREVKCGSRTSLGSKQSETHTRSSKISSTQSQTLNRDSESLEKMTTKSSEQSQKSCWLPEIRASANSLVDGGASQKQCVHSSSSIVHCHTLEQDSHKSLSDEKQVAAVSSRKSRRSSHRNLRSAKSNVVVADDNVSSRKSSFSEPAMAHVSFSNKSMKSQASGTVQKTGSAVENKPFFKTVSAIAEQTEKGDSLSNMSNTKSIQMETAAMVKATSGVKTSVSSSRKYSQATLKAKSYAGVSILPSKVKKVPKLSSSVASFRSSDLANAVSGLERRRISTPEKSVLQQEKSELITAVQFDMHSTEKKCSRRSRHGSERKLMGESSRDSVEQSSRKSIPDGVSATKVDNSQSDKNDDRLPPLMQPETVSLPAIGGSQQMGFDVTAWMRANRDVVIAKQSSKKTSSGLDSKRIAKSQSDKGYAKLPPIMKRQNRSLPDNMNRSYWNL